MVNISGAAIVQKYTFDLSYLDDKNFTGISGIYLAGRTTKMPNVTRQLDMLDIVKLRVKRET